MPMVSDDRMSGLYQPFETVYRVPQMQGVGCADVLLYFTCPTTKQMRCPVNAYDRFIDTIIGIV
jgi:hypothetical protein